MSVFTFCWLLRCFRLLKCFIQNKERISCLLRCHHIINILSKHVGEETILCFIENCMGVIFIKIFLMHLVSSFRREPWCPVICPCPCPSLHLLCHVMSGSVGIYFLIMKPASFFHLCHLSTGKRT